MYLTFSFENMQFAAAGNAQTPPLLGASDEEPTCVPDRRLPRPTRDRARAVRGRARLPGQGSTQAAATRSGHARAPGSRRGQARLRPLDRRRTRLPPAPAALGEPGRFDPPRVQGHDRDVALLRGRAHRRDARARPQRRAARGATGAQAPPLEVGRHLCERSDRHHGDRSSPRTRPPSAASAPAGASSHRKARRPRPRS